MKEFIKKKIRESLVGWSDLNRLEKELDNLFRDVGIDIEFTRHFLDRVNDPRNRKPITVEELRQMFYDIYKQYGEKIGKLPDRKQGVFQNNRTNVNIPFALNKDTEDKLVDLINKTIMRKKSFRPAPSDIVMNVNSSVPQESINEVIEGGNYIVYHGTPKKFESFTDEFVGGENATDQEGPGIYFTTSFDDAANYGKYIYQVKLSPRRLLDLSEDKDIDRKLLVKLIKMKPDWEMNAQDWDEDPDTGVEMAVDSAFEYNDNEKDVFLQIWIDFYRYDSVDFVRNMVKLGYDGIFVPKEHGITHIIVYNPSIIEIMDIKEI